MAEADTSWHHISGPHIDSTAAREKLYTISWRFSLQVPASLKSAMITLVVHFGRCSTIMKNS